jgi:hypothetical protein
VATAPYLKPRSWQVTIFFFFKGCFARVATNGALDLDVVDLGSHVEAAAAFRNLKKNT